MHKALVMLAQGCEEIEAVTIIDILRRGGIEVTSAGLDDLPVLGSHSVMLLADTTLDLAQHQDFDMIVLPGGLPGTDNLRADKRLIALLQKMAQQGKHIAAICAAPSVLAAAGLLDGRKATCYPTCLDDFPKVCLQTAAVVEDGNIVTSRGPGTAMDFALALVERLAGKAKQEEVEAALVR
ncbi:MAG: 4-methyl-5(B-hydroxyethyl)-thiazole monophosphate biosynthesis protein [Gallionellales bacterium RIFCSPLOWO2_12_FULL_59_22]|nr:MAG: 4-methyl-5(B-hydroxyethyl)-thiazole monophosphate biosynthesis protein [Gallionellales bacterium RIFCSPLOWO2_02_FULL_59_110]OGT02005.1 MAG: 4-methyl-5(B-hydroxyethyl)-thiazole monophosphate biosynthesis protein [Gallionellales bacterium RIFCSPLOWO2_02_58_13]OGT11410.1 MAG: 4-methyl-5(B-hydroxyethyl)-thiazole monophosphate biosynthesis protein [Gallionellales bacterium RIFCSPLOWO2_12_FULL_59_22]